MKRILFSLAALALCAATCRPALKEHALAPYFESMAPPEMLLFQISEDSSTAMPGKIVPNAVFFRSLPAGLLQDIDYVADSSMAVVTALRRFPLDESLEAWWVDIRQAWFQHQSLLLYNRKQGEFTRRISVAEWYGGDGGQILIGSYLTDYDGDGKKDIVRREIQHSLLVDGDEPRDVFSETAILLRGQNGGFTEQALTDSAAVAQRFPLKSPW